MASLVLSGDTSGSITVAAPAVSGSNTQTLAAVTGTLAPIVSGTAVTSTSGTSLTSRASLRGCQADYGDVEWGEYEWY
jgi:hypothetical protein